MTARLRIALLLLLVAACGAVATRVRVSADLADALPQDGQAGAALRDVQRFSLLDTLVIEIDGTGRTDAELHAAVDALGERLAKRDTLASVRYQFGLHDGIALRRAADPHRGALADEALLTERLSPEGMAATLERARARLLSPAGAMMARGLESDPLDLGGAFTESVTGLGAMGGVELREGHLVSSDGEHALILARAKGPALGTSLDSPLVMGLREDLAASTLPADWIGSHRYAAEARQLIEGEVKRAVTAGLVLLSLVFLLAFRSLRPLLGALPAMAVGGAAASAAAGLVSPLHGMALAFGGALAGMGVDYWIHLYLTGVRDGVAPTFAERLEQGEAALRHLLPAYGISVGATLTAFAMLGTSSYAAVSDLAAIGAGSAIGAFFSVVIGGPLFFAAVARPGDRIPTLPVPERVPLPLATLLLLGLAVLAGFGSSVRFDGDPRSLDARLPETARVEAAFKERYGGDDTSGLVVAEGRDLAEATALLRAAVTPLQGAPGLALRTPLPLLPSPADVSRRAALLADPALEARFVAAADAAGFAPDALLPGLRATLAATDAPTLQTWAGTPVEELLQRTVHVGDDGVAVAALVDAATPEALAHARYLVDLAGVDARFVYPAAIAAEGSERIRVELLTRSGLALLGVLLFMVLRYRDVPRVLAAALPSLAAAAGTMGVLTLTGQPLTPVSGPAFVLVLGLAFDQGIFLVEAGDSDRSAFLASRAAILVALATALAGFVGLCFAGHPGVFSVGATVSLGIAFTFLAAFAVVPALLTPEGTQRARRWARRLGLAVVVFLNVDALLSLLGQVRPPDAPSSSRAYTIEQASPSDRRYGPNRLVRDNGVWVLRVEGTAYEVGRAIGELGAPLARRNEDAFIEEFYTHVPNRLARWLLVRGVPLFAPRMAESVDPAVLEELRGLTDVGEDKWGWVSPHYTRKLCYHAVHDIGQAMVDSPLVACTGFVAGGSRTADGHWLVARNWDFDGGTFFDEDKAVIAVQREGAIPFAHVAIVGLLGVVSGVNAEGIAVTVLAGASDAAIEPSAPMIFLVREVLEKAHSLAEAKEILESRSKFVSEGLLIADGETGEAAVFEVTPERVAVLPAGEWIALSNHFRADDHKGDAANLLRMAEGTTVARLERMEELTREGVLDLDSAVAILRDRDGVGGRDLPDGHESALDADIASHGVILDATSRSILVSVYPNLSGGFVRYDLDDLLAGDLGGEVVAGPRDPATTLRVHEAKRLRRAAKGQSAGVAEASLRKALRLNPGEPTILLALAERRLAAGDAAEAAALAQAALDTPPARASEARQARRILSEAQ